MKDRLDAFYRFLERPIFFPARPLLVALLLPLLLSFALPLWRISMEAPQYPQGLYMDIYAHKLSGGNDGHDITEINTLNHYIGMHRIDRTQLADLDWIPFLFGGLLLLALRVAAIGDVRSLLDLLVISGYACGFAMARFIYRLYVFGHDLAADAPVRVQPFTPVILGTKQIANFTTHSHPQAGTLCVGLYLVGLGAIVLWHLIAGHREARRRG